jgi:hypothetical protein
VKRITINVHEELLERLREVARREGLSLAAVIRQGLEWRVAQTGAPLRFVATGASSGRPDDVGRQAGEMPFEPVAWR